MINLDKSILVVAHPDDEILWFSSIVHKIAEVVICFLELGSNPTLSMGRKRVIENYPLKNTSCLGLKESNIFNDENWKTPKLTPFGLKVTGNRRSIGRYKNNYSTLMLALDDKLYGYEHVFTHSPWGEYGHEEHVQLFRVIKDLQESHNFNIWCPSYVSNKSYPLLSSKIDQFNPQYVSYPTPDRLTREIKSLYEENLTWTWFKDWQWPANDIFLRDAGQTDKHRNDGLTFPLNWIYVKLTSPPKRNKIPFWQLPTRKIKNRLKALLTN